MTGDFTLLASSVGPNFTLLRESEGLQVLFNFVDPPRLKELYDKPITLRTKSGNGCDFYDKNGNFVLHTV